MLNPGHPHEISLYLHIPFCASKCDYCDFTSFPFKKTRGYVERYFQVLCDEFEDWIRFYPYEIRFQSIYIGGGTPSLITPESYRRLFERITPHLSEECEFTCEVNPGSVNESFLLFMKEAGCNRISMGLQSPSNTTLRTINRHQTIERFFEKYSLIRKLYENVNMDFICGLPEQLDDWVRESLPIVSALQPEHVSVYILEAEKETPLSIKYERGELQLPSMQYTTAVFEEFAWFLKTLGYHRYEISNFSKDGYEAEHNRVYWDYGQYIGIGVSAGGHVNRIRYVNTPSLKDYLELGESEKRFEYIEERALTEDLKEMLFMGLRYRKGFHKNKLFNRIMLEYDAAIYKKLEMLLFLLEASIYFIVENDRIRLNDYYFIHNREAFEYFIAVFEKVFQS